MRYVDINQFLGIIPEEVKARLERKHQELVDGNDQTKLDVIGTGNATWSQVKSPWEETYNRKCWYTESTNPGCVNSVDHYRPKGKIMNSDGEIKHWYWFLAFDPENYRLSCQFSNGPKTNPETGVTGGKWDEFPLPNGQNHSTTKAGIDLENPVILDPCNEDDCDLIEFQFDGRPVVSSRHKDNPDACYRVELNKLLLNLDYPTFNEDREILYNRIEKLVKRGDRYGADNPARQDVEQDLQELMTPDKPYSKAAECYVRCFRDRDWVDRLF